MAIAAVGQLCSTSSMTHNLAQCRVLIQKAVAARAKVWSSSLPGLTAVVLPYEQLSYFIYLQALFLPEASDYICSSSGETIALALSPSKSPFVTGLQEEAHNNSLPIQVGIHEPTDDSSRVRNTLIWIDANGAIAHSYHKLHLFDVDLPGGPTLKESDSVEAGSSILAPFESSLGKIGSMICFDLRFPMLSSYLRDLGSQILTYPSAFTVSTGEAGHWEVLLRARAIENQVYILAAAQVGNHGGNRMSYGHSMIIDPWYVSSLLLVPASSALLPLPPQFIEKYCALAFASIAYLCIFAINAIFRWTTYVNGVTLLKALVFPLRGRKLAEAGGIDDYQARKGPNLITADLDLREMMNIRSRMPLNPRRQVVDVMEGLKS